MERHFHEQLRHLRHRLIVMGAAVENAIADSVKALSTPDDLIAGEVIGREDGINRMEMEIDDLCLMLLALHQPMAVDLRFITSAMKINNDLERMADHSVNIAQASLKISGSRFAGPLGMISEMAEIAQGMVRDSLQSFIDEDAEQAREVCSRDDRVDRLDDEVFKQMVTWINGDSNLMPAAMAAVLISKNLERIADLSTNIAEEVIFIVQARNIKHHQEDGEIVDMRSK
ncbi:phosphate signaling complex protein PhoU [bacterium]|nr:phosphate signaling complex protein PhoU [bacterium]